MLLLGKCEADHPLAPAAATAVAAASAPAAPAAVPTPSPSVAIPLSVTEVKEVKLNVGAGLVVRAGGRAEDVYGRHFLSTLQALLGSALQEPQRINWGKGSL